MTQKIVRKILENAAKSWAAANSINVAWENVTFNPPVDGVYARSSMIPGRTMSDMLDGAHRGYIGVYQLTLVAPRNIGPRIVEDLIISMDAYFTTTAPLVDGSSRVFITSPMSAGPPEPYTDQFVVPVSCTYRADFVT